MFKHTEENMINLVAKHQNAFCTSYEVLIPNCYTTHDNEADLFAIRKTGFCDEFEVKTSRADFFNDAKKKVHYRKMDRNDPLDLQHFELVPRPRVSPWEKLKYKALVDGDMTANYFWYVLKDGIVSLEEVPAFAGVIFVDDDGDYWRKRSPKRLHSNKLSYEQRFAFCKKLGFRFWDSRVGKHKRLGLQ